jgi:hypothetical protein
MEVTIMKHTKTQQGPVEALNVLIDNYQPLIKGNKILKEDVDLLKRNLEAQASCYDMQCKYLLVHLRAEVQESVEDHLRLGDESQVEKDDNTLLRDKQYLDFKSDIDRFYATYFVDNNQIAA